MTHQVHNHGTEGDPGLGCPETRTATGALLGACMADSVDDDPTLQDTLDALDDTARTLWALVDDVTPYVHDEDDPARRLELRAVQEHTAQAWAQAQHAVVVLRTLIALDGPAVNR